MCLYSIFDEEFQHVEFMQLYSVYTMHQIVFFKNICAGTIVGMPILINTTSKNKHNSVVEWTNESLEISAEIQGIFTSQQKKSTK